MGTWVTSKAAGGGRGDNTEWAWYQCVVRGTFDVFSILMSSPVFNMGTKRSVKFRVSYKQYIQYVKHMYAIVHCTLTLAHDKGKLS